MSEAVKSYFPNLHVEDAAAFLLALGIAISLALFSQ